MEMWTSLARGALLAPACAVFGLIAQRMKLPQITGYLVMGILMGPHGLKVFSHQDVTQLWVVDHACLGVIVLAAGAELHWEQLRKIHKQVTPKTSLLVRDVCQPQPLQKQRCVHTSTPSPANCWSPTPAYPAPPQSRSRDSVST